MSEILKWKIFWKKKLKKIKVGKDEDGNFQYISFFFFEKLNNKALFTPTFKIRIYEFYRESRGVLMSVSTKVQRSVSQFVNQDSDRYLLKDNNRNARTRCGICSKLTIKTLQRRHWFLYC